MTRKIKILGLILIIITGHVVYGQTTFNYLKDFNSILENTKNNTDSLAYEKLLIRFVTNDTTMTDFEVLALLIGFTGKPDFKPYGYLSTEKEIYKLNSEGKFQEALDLANIVLKNYPVSQQAIIEKSFSYYKLENKDSSDFYMFQFRRIMQAMDFSGEGEGNPIFALSPADGQNYIRKYLEAKIISMGSGIDKNGNFIDIIEVIYKDGTFGTLYFHIKHATNKMFYKDE